ncbi:GCN5-related N-acetyltransferase [Alkaliphilus metalliredigens QYMF]|uniref:GCN5-related N-acetyltransferase n=1 Tax=Alkaliphilus metalliredigens (strain QYMF) TaxID=293826 RepID=A6TNV6_ALKMQ|nr:arsinothricin resistance N-acetyltransferase ArsN1 family A [Alkaliphilus metalliredigens]ABR47874.1 GCN5-related N-acetyltransferase [Alkaliphilus metalliredigens QYMF]
MAYTVRIAELQDLKSITEIYNEGIEDRIATLETKIKSEAEMIPWLQQRSEKHKVITIENERDEVLGWASLNPFNSRCCYDGVADFSIYIKRQMRGMGLGKLLLKALIEVAREQDIHKLVLSTFKSNEAGQRLYESFGFREVGTYKNQGILDGKFVDVTIMEKLLIDGL